MDKNNELSMDDLNQTEAQVKEKLQVKDRFAKLSEKMTLTAQEKDQAEAKAKAESEARVKVEKERDFFRDFSQLSSRYPNAAHYQDKILEKVNAGYSAEDATLAILAKEGKLQPITADTYIPTQSNVAGGSAATAMTDSFGDKRPEEMTQAERRQVLQDMENQGINLLKL
jgi:hypothetical protein